MRPLFIAVLVSCAFVGSVRAATLHVPSEYASIQAGIDAAAFGDTVLVAPGTYTNCDGGPCDESIATLTEGVTVLSEAGADATKLVAAGEGTAFLVVGGGDVQIEGFEISGVGPVRGALIFESERVTVKRCRFKDIESTASSGAGARLTGASATFIDCTFLRCSAGEIGGAVYAAFSDVRFEQCRFEDSQPIATTIGSFGEGHFEACTWIGNVGGGLSLSEVAGATVNECSFINNVKDDYGAGLSLASSAGPINVTRSLFLRNQAALGGGGALLSATSVNVIECTFVGNAAGFGSAAYVLPQGRTITLQRNVFALSADSPALASELGEPAGGCNLFWANGAGDYAGYQPHLSDVFEDPQFCDIPNDDYTVRSTSPCAEENSPVCGQIGAYRRRLRHRLRDPHDLLPHQVGVPDGGRP